MPNDKRPSKSWFNSKVKEIQKGNPDYSKDQAEATAGEIWYNKMSESDREKARKQSSIIAKAFKRIAKKQAKYKKTSEFKNLFNKQYKDWIIMEAKLLAQNNYGQWSSVEEANAFLDKATQEIIDVLAKGVPQEVKRIIEEEKSDIVEEMTEDIVEGPDLPQMGPDQQVVPQQGAPQQAPGQAVPQQEVPQGTPRQKKKQEPVTIQPPNASLQRIRSAIRTAKIELERD